MSGLVAWQVACRCLNVQVTIRITDDVQLSSTTNDEHEYGVRTLTRDVKVSSINETSMPVVHVAQAPLTSRLTPYTLDDSQSSSGASTLTALCCVNCDTTVYAVDRIHQPKNGGRNARSTGFNVGSSSSPSSSSTSNGRVTAAAAVRLGNVDVEHEQKLLPDPEGGSVWLLKGCVCGSDVIRTLSSSADFSKSFKLLVKLPDQSATTIDGLETLSKDNEERLSRSGIARRSARGGLDSSGVRGQSNSPQRTLAFLKNRSDTSPSPARRRNVASAEHEEEQGEDLDTLHLLETLLPHVPSSLTDDSRSSVKGDQSATAAAARRNLSNENSASPSFRSPDKAGSSSKRRYFDYKLDEQGIAMLRSRVRDVQQELYQLLKLRSLEINQEQERLRKEAQFLAQKHVRSLTSAAARREAGAAMMSTGGGGRVRQGEAAGTETKGPSVSLYGGGGGGETTDDAESTSPTIFVRRRPYVPAMEKTASQDSDASRRVGSGSSAVGVPGRESYGQTTTPSNVGSYLSASFAMRGRDLPGKPEESAQRSKEDEEDWFAQKKRLRERYPHADHSALPSAVNSDDEEAVAVKVRDQQDSSDSEQDQRRGRERGRQTQQVVRVHSQKTPTPPRKGKTSPESGAKRDHVRRAIGSDTSGSFGEDGSHGAKTMRGALKRTTAAGGNSSNEQRTAVATEKKVAFASTTEEHDIAPVSRVADRSLSPPEPVGPGDALFEIDEDLEDVDESSPSTDDGGIDTRVQAALEGGKDQMIRVALDDEMGGFDAEADGRRRESAGEVVAQETNVAYALPIAGSFSVMAETESRRASLAAGLAEENAIDFDPASLRFDGRTVYASGIGETLPVIYSPPARSAEHSPLSTGKEVVSPSADLNRPSVQNAVKPIRTTEIMNSDRKHGSAIGFRVAVGEAEARLSGLLAPHAPSHRGLYAVDERRKRSAEKYVLNSLDEEEEEESSDQSSADSSEIVTTASATLSGFSSGKGKVVMGGGVKSKDLLSSRDGAAPLASSVPAKAQMMIRRSSSALQRDATSGFILEPKTSLPYQEKMLTPSLRKAMRAQASSSLHRPSLGAISDTSDNTTASGSVQQGTVGRRSDERAQDTAAVNIAKSTNTPNKQPDFQYSVPASVTRGFETSGLGISQATTVQAASSVVGTTVGLGPLPKGVLSASAFSHSAQSSPMLGSSAGTGRSSRQRSPRPPYVQPPPPSTTDMRLTPDDEHRPQSIALAKDSQVEDDYDIADVLRFMHTIENLKTFKRTGWYHHRIERPESIADHMYRMALLSMLLPARDLDIGRCVQLCIVHDLAEALVGDLTPLDGVSKEEKLRREHDAIQHLVYDQLDGSEMGLRIEMLWNEYEDRHTNEAKAVKDLDRFELALQAVEYERRNKTADLQPFYSSAKDIGQSRVQSWMLGLARERETLWKGTEYSYDQVYPNSTTTKPEEEEGDKTVQS